MRALLAAPLLIAFLTVSAAAVAQDDDQPLPPPPPPPPGAVIPEERPTPPTPAPPPPPSAKPAPAKPAPLPTPAPPTSAQPPTPPPPGSVPPPAPVPSTVAPAPVAAPPSPAPDVGEAPKRRAPGELPPPPPSPAGATAEQPLRGPEVPPDDAPQGKPKKKKSGWYGWQIIIMDGSALGLLVMGDGLYVLAVPTYVLGGPLVHTSHRHLGKGAISLLLRVGVPFVAGTVSAQYKHCSLAQSNECSGGLHPATLLSAIGVSVFDIVFLARDPKEPAAKPVHAQTFSVSPSVAVDRHGAQGFLVGRF